MSDIQLLGAEDISPATAEKLRSTAERAVSFFREHFGDVRAPIKLDVHRSQPALRTGYNTVSDTICFPDLKNLRNAGLDSVDVINHEIFHALVSQNYPATRGTDPDFVRLHEGLADYFAYQLNPDNSFGEDFEIGKSSLRQYHNQLAVSLSPGPHAQGNALTSLLLKNQIATEQIRTFLSERPFTLEGLGSVSPDLKRDLDRDASFSLPEIPGNYPTSVLHRYHIEDTRPLKVSFQANQGLLEAHSDLRVQWTTLSGIPSCAYFITQQSPVSFTVGRAPGAGPEKLLAVFKDGEDTIGSRPFYFGPEHSKPTA